MFPHDNAVISPVVSDNPWWQNHWWPTGINVHMGGSRRDEMGVGDVMVTVMVELHPWGWVLMKGICSHGEKWIVICSSTSEHEQSRWSGVVIHDRSIPREMYISQWVVLVWLMIDDLVIYPVWITAEVVWFHPFLTGNITSYTNLIPVKFLPVL